MALQRLLTYLQMPNTAYIHFQALNTKREYDMLWRRVLAYAKMIGSQPIQ